MRTKQEHKAVGPSGAGQIIALFWMPSLSTLQAIPACLCALDGVEAGKVAAEGPLGSGVGCVRRWPRLNHLVALTVVVTMHRFLSDGVACKSDRQSDRRDKAFDHGIPQSAPLLPALSISRDVRIEALAPPHSVHHLTHTCEGLTLPLSCALRAL
jgi:hypothetical protein